MATSQRVEKRAHVCPPSNAIHPSHRWESLFVYSFICKFTNLRHKVEGLESPMDLENALLSKEPNSILSQLLAHFIVNLKPQTRNLSTDQISTTVASVLAEYCKSTERTIFWNDDLKANIDPFEGLEGGFFTTDWDFKLKVLRQLVELQLCHAPDIKAAIDRAWGVQHNKHKKQAPLPPLDPSDPKNQESLQLQPIGQDCSRKRFWVTDDSPRIYVSTNPWKTTATFQSISTSREDYVAVVESLKAAAPPEPKKGQRRTKLEQGHLSLIDALENRLEAIDVELARVQKVRKKIDQKRLLLAQAEIRQTRTRRRTKRPDYVYGNDLDSEDDGADEYTYHEEGQDEDEQDYMNGGTRRGRSGTVATRRSARASAINANGKRDGSSDSGIWRGERRSTRLGGPDYSLDVEPSRKRARTEESTSSAHSTEQSLPPDNVGFTNGVRVKASGAAALKPTEIALEQIAGKKKSKFWVYAVEPIPGAAESTHSPTRNGHSSETNDKDTDRSSPARTNGHSNQMEGLEGIFSPVHSR